MKVKTISRDSEFARECKTDIYRTRRNVAPELHPHEQSREYTRALNAVKLTKLFARPFVAQLSSHIDKISAIFATAHGVASSSLDGTVKLWDLTAMGAQPQTVPFAGPVHSLCSKVGGSAGDVFVGSAGTGIKMFGSAGQTQDFTSPQHITASTHHYSRNLFATCGSVVHLWDHARSAPTQTLSWGADTITSAKFNPSETSLLVSASNDRTLILYDIRTSTPTHKQIMALKTNQMAWNPMEPLNFTTASEDHNTYTFDMRNLTRALVVGKGHVAAVLDISYCPTGNEFVTGSYDKTIRVFKGREGTSREVYHTQRMQRTFCVAYTLDSKFIISGSDDGSLRVWKSNASEQLGTVSIILTQLTNRESSSIAYKNTLTERYKNMPEIRRIDRHKKVPKQIKTASTRKRIMIDAENVKESNRRKHGGKDYKGFVSERKKNILATLE